MVDNKEQHFRPSILFSTFSAIIKSNHLFFTYKWKAFFSADAPDFSILFKDFFTIAYEMRGKGTPNSEFEYPLQSTWLSLFCAALKCQFVKKVDPSNCWSEKYVYLFFCLYWNYPADFHSSFSFIVSEEGEKCWVVKFEMFNTINIGLDGFGHSQVVGLVTK